MVINGSCSTNMYARQLSFNFSSMVWGAMARAPSPLDPPLDLQITVQVVCIENGHHSAATMSIWFIPAKDKKIVNSRLPPCAICCHCMR